MTEVFNEYRFLFPPRPDIALPAANMGIAKTWTMQTKKNGTNNIIGVSPDKKLICKQRDGTNHVAWSPSPKSSKIFEETSGKGWYVFSAELLHSKTPHIKDTNYVHDILVNDGVYLTGTTFIERQKILHDLFLSKYGFQSDTPSHWCIDNNTWLAKTYYAGIENVNYESNNIIHCNGFVKFYKTLHLVEDEGIVMKKPDAKLMACSKADSNSAWQLKCRIFSNKYSF